MKKRLATTITAAALSACMLFAGCAGAPAQEDSAAQETPGEGVVSQLDLAAQVQEKYADDLDRDYTDAINGIGRGDSLEIQISFDPEALGMENYTEIVGVYQDAELTQRIGTHFNWDKETGKIEITPPKSPVLGISTVGLPDAGAAEYHLFDKGEQKDWGNLGKMYLAQYVDLGTGEKLEKPLVTVVTVEGELAGAPEVKFVQTEDGRAAFQWNAVAGAEKYYVVKADYDAQSGYVGNMVVVAETAEPGWQAETTDNILINEDFRAYAVSEDDWLDEAMTEYYTEKGYTQADIPVQKEALYDVQYGVIAVAADGTSMVSNFYDQAQIAAQLPYMAAIHKGDDDFSNYADSIMAAPSHRWIVMCNGVTSQRIIDYDFDQAQEETETWGEYENEDMSDLQLKEVNLVKIPYRIEGTPFTGVMKIESYDPATLQADLQALKDRQDGLRNKTGSVDVTVKKNAEDAGAPQDEPVAETGLAVTANSALSEYLAYNMLAGVEVIDLSAFKESSDEDYLIDAWMEALYQNPMILGVEDAFISNDGTAMLVVYQDEAQQRTQKQQEISQEVTRVIDEIITDGMTDAEKEIAINNYLCDTAEYDMAALENAEKYDYVKTDPEFNDSFTPYGVLVNKLGVCASYARAFKLLADEAGLNSIVVTGYLEGSLSHAWNKVNIGGEWQIIDVTNNDNELLFNAILNLPDYASDKVLTEDTRFVMDKNIQNYAASSTDEEYYRLAGKYFDMDQIAQELAEALMADGQAMMRTDYDLDDAQFQKLAQNVMELAGIDEMNGFYWMGVITLAA